MKFTFNYPDKPKATLNVVDVVLDGINFADAPDFCDTFIESAKIEEGGVVRKATDHELDLMSDDGGFVYEQLMAHLY